MEKVPSANAPIGVHFAWLSSRANDMGYPSLYSVILHQINADVEHCASLPRGSKLMTDANSMVYRHATEFVAFAMSVVEIENEKFQSKLQISDEKAAMGVFKMLRTYLVGEIRQLTKAMAKPAVEYLRRKCPK